jgi:adenine-specific DNA-methyltransferase
MASLAEREGLRGKVQCIYLDPPYGIKFNSNFQWSTTSRDVKDGNTDHITREPEQVKAFRDTWRDGIHSYLTYLRDRLTVARDLLAYSGSIFVQIGDENVHRVRAVMDEVFGNENFVAQISFKTTDPLGQTGLAKVYDYLIWYAKDAAKLKFRPLFREREIFDDKEYRFIDTVYSELVPTDRSSEEFRDLVYRRRNATSSGYTQSCIFDLSIFGKDFPPPGRKSWSSNREGMNRVARADRLFLLGKDPYYKQYHRDFPLSQLENCWTDKPAAQAKRYVVETAEKFIQRCLLMTTAPGDLVLDPTCGSGTTAYVAEQWGRRWITIDTSRVALALARARIMGARYPYYLLADSPEGQLKEAEVMRSAPSSQPTRGDIRQGFVYERVPHITLKSIANNAEIDVIWEQWQTKLEPLREALNKELQKSWQEWEIPRDAEAKWSAMGKQLHAEWWQARIARQKEIDASIAAKAEFEYLYDKPYDDKKRVRVAGPFTVESLSPHRVLGVDENDELIDGVAESEDGYGEERGFVQMILENLKTAGVQ